jgi:TRAP-type C4-dicarboxylate transport system substrate-binding protein
MLKGWGEPREAKGMGRVESVWAASSHFLEERIMTARKITGITLILAWVFFTFASSSFAQKHTIRLGHIATTDHPTHLATLKFAEWVNSRSQGALKVQIYPNSQLGDERDVQEGMQLGTVEMAITGTAIVGKFQPEYNKYLIWEYLPVSSRLFP